MEKENRYNIGYVICPECKHVNIVQVRNLIGKDIINCNDEEGGCGKNFAFKWHIFFQANIETSKINWSETGRGEL